MRNPRNLWLSIAFVLTLVVAVLVVYFTGTKPVLGLDLEGGVSVVLTAPSGTPKDVMDQALENIRNRIDALGVAEPQLFVNGNNIEVQIPGLARGTIEQQSKHQFCLIGQSQKDLGCFPTEDAANTALKAAQVKPSVTQACLVDKDGKELNCYGTEDAANTALKGLTAQQQNQQWCLAPTGGTPTFGCFGSQKEANAAKDAITTKVQQQYCVVGQDSKQLGCYSTQEDADAALSAIKVTEEHTQYCVLGSDGKVLPNGCFLTQDQAQAALQATGQDRLLQIIGTTARLEQRQVLQAITSGDPAFKTTPVTCPTTSATSSQPAPDCTPQALEDKPVTFVSQNGATKYKLSKVLVPGDAISKATAVFNTGTSGQTGWQIDFTMTPSGAKTFSDVTGNLVSQATPENELAIVLDQKVISAPAVQGQITTGSGQITGSFTEQRAKDLATVLNAGALPVQLTKSQIQTVSPTLGKESLHQGLVAGIVGLIALALYLLFYYRLLGIVTWFGMAIWAILTLGLISILGRTVGYSLSLAGIAGVIVSMGITADSYIVFYERLKDEVRHGKTPRSAIVPAFGHAWHTIVAADTVTILAAAVLYVLTIGSVRGFALTLGLATLLDMFVVFFFKRPTVFLLARSERLTNLKGMGLTSGVAADPMPLPAVAGGSK
ncbi:MAG: protein translocase subunit SecD [Actinomycetota bacterium]